jgi:predicted nucleotidyltransferase
VLDQALLDRIRQAAQMLKQRGARAVYLFGSAARGALHGDSDVDLAVTGLPDDVFFRAMADASRIVGLPVDLVALDRNEAVARSLYRSGELKRVA